MEVVYVNRRYFIGGRWFRYQRMKGVRDLGFKIAFGKHELRFYKN